jgi:hypothetical protein
LSEISARATLDAAHDSASAVQIPRAFMIFSPSKFFSVQAGRIVTGRLSSPRSVLL